jgi:hypothetical protein
LVHYSLIQIEVEFELPTEKAEFQGRKRRGVLSERPQFLTPFSAEAIPFSPTDRSSVSGLVSPNSRLKPKTPQGRLRTFTSPEDMRIHLTQQSSSNPRIQNDAAIDRQTKEDFEVTLSLAHAYHDLAAAEEVRPAIHLSETKDYDRFEPLLSERNLTSS